MNVLEVQSLGKVYHSRGDNRQAYFHHILDSLSVLGGNFDDVSFARA